MGFEFKPSIWFVCRFCREAFSYLYKLKEHKVECHLGECLNTKCLIFEEKCLNYEWVPSTDRDPHWNQYSDIQHIHDDSSPSTSNDDGTFISRLNITNRQNTYNNPFVSIQRLTLQELNHSLNHNASFSHINSRNQDTQSPGCRGFKRAADIAIIPQSAQDDEGDEPWTEKKCKSEVDVEISTLPVTEETVFEPEVKKIELNLEDSTYPPDIKIISQSVSDFISMPNDKDSQEIELEDQEFIVASIVQSSDGTGNIQFVSTNTQFPLLEHALTFGTVSTSASDFDYGLDSDSKSQTNWSSNLDINTSGNGDISLPYLSFKRVAEIPALDVQVIGSPEMETSPNRVASNRKNYNCPNRGNGNGTSVTGSQPESRARSKFGQVLPTVTLTPEDHSLPLLDWLTREKVSDPSNVILLHPYPSSGSITVVPKVFQPIRCILCQLTLTSEMQVKVHVKVCWTFNKAKHLHCVPCDKSYAYTYSLKRHCKTVHSSVVTSTADSQIAEATNVSESTAAEANGSVLQNPLDIGMHCSTRRNESNVNYSEAQVFQGCSKDFFTVRDVEDRGKLCQLLRPQCVKTKQTIETVDDDVQVIMSTTKGGSATEIASDDDNYNCPSDSESERDSESDTEPRPRSQGNSKVTLRAEKYTLPLKEWLILQKETKHSDGSLNVILINPDPTIIDRELPAIDENHPVTCLLCSRLLFTEIDVRIHLENCWWHNKSKHRRCVPCEFTFESSYELRRHQKYDHLCEDEENVPLGKRPKITHGSDQLDDSDVEDIILYHEGITLGDWIKKLRTKSGNIVLLDPDPTTNTTPLTITKASPIRCQLCSKELHSERQVKSHVKACWHYNKKRHSYCVLCLKAFSCRDDPSFHTLQVHPKGPEFRFYCTFCKSGFNDGQAAQRHSLSFREFLNRRANRKYAENPPAATNTTSKPQDISFIEWLKHQKETNPSNCIVLEPDPLSVAYNFEGVSEVNSVTCKLCSRKFTGESVLKSHVESWLQNKQIHRYCLRCEKTYSGTTRFRAHYAIKHLILPRPTYVCKVCTKPFVGYNGLTTHESTPMDSEKAKTFKCQLCDKSFELKDQLTAHMFSHSSEKPFKCPQCPAEFTRKHALTCHLAAHNKDKHSANICKFCGRTFRFKETLRFHESHSHYK